MPQVESLTVQILGDSSGLQQELNSVADQLDTLQQQLGEATQGAGEFGEAFGGLSSALAPLQQISNSLSAVTQQVQLLSSQSITLDVQPALNALGQLLQSAQATAAGLAAVSAAAMLGPVMGPVMGPRSGVPTLPGFSAMPGPTGPRPEPRQYASGGIVTGPTGIDQVSAQLTAGEFVLNRQAVAALGIPQLDQWNRGDLNDTGVDSLRLSQSQIPPTSQPLASLSQSLTAFGGLRADTSDPHLDTGPRAGLHTGDRSPYGRLIVSSHAWNPAFDIQGEQTDVTNLAAERARSLFPGGNLPNPQLLYPEPAQRAIPVSPYVSTIESGRMQRHRGTHETRSMSSATIQTTNQFGGIEIHVQEVGDIGELMHDLRRQGISLRHRRG